MLHISIHLRNCLRLVSKYFARVWNVPCFEPGLLFDQSVVRVIAPHSGVTLLETMVFRDIDSTFTATVLAPFVFVSQAWPNVMGEYLVHCSTSKSRMICLFTCSSASGTFNTGIREALLTDVFQIEALDVNITLLFRISCWRRERRAPRW